MNNIDMGMCRGGVACYYSSACSYPLSPSLLLSLISICLGVYSLSHYMPVPLHNVLEGSELDA